MTVKIMSRLTLTDIETSGPRIGLRHAGSPRPSGEGHQSGRGVIAALNIPRRASDDLAHRRLKNTPTGRGLVAEPRYLPRADPAIFDRRRTRKGQER
jgi:hypothetical protein